MLSYWPARQRQIITLKVWTRSRSTQHQLWWELLLSYSNVLIHSMAINEQPWCLALFKNKDIIKSKPKSVKFQDTELKHYRLEYKTSKQKRKRAHTGAEGKGRAPVAADIPSQSIPAVFRRVINEDKSASITNAIVDGIPRPQGDEHGVQITVLW